MCSLGLGAVAEPALASLFLAWLEPVGLSGGDGDRAGLRDGVGIVVFLHMVVGEMVPKNLALADAERIASRFPAAFGVHPHLRPLIVVLNATANGIVRLTGVRARGGDRARSHTG
jgi:CBS domain containing-hemolysin-like protein